MADLMLAMLTQFEKSEVLRVVTLWGVTALLAVVFLALLIGDQVHAATF